MCHECVCVFMCVCVCACVCECMCGVEKGLSLCLAIDSHSFLNIILSRIFPSFSSEKIFLDQSVKGRFLAELLKFL